MADQKHINLTISRVNGPVYSGEANWVTVPGVDGEMTLLADHEAIISPLRAGVITVQRTDETTETFDVESGTLEMSENQATILI